MFRLVKMDSPRATRPTRASRRILCIAGCPHQLPQPGQTEAAEPASETFEFVQRFSIWKNFVFKSSFQ